MKRRLFRVGSFLAAAVFSAGLFACKGGVESEIELRYVTIGGGAPAGGNVEISDSVRELVERIASSPWELALEMVFVVDVNELPAGEMFVDLGAEVKKAVEGGRPKNIKFDKLLIRFDPVYETRHISVAPAAEGESIDGQLVYLTDVPSSAVTAALESLGQR